MSSASPVSCNAHKFTLPEEVREKMERALREGNWPQVFSIVREAMKTMSTSPVSIAVSGDSGNGVSSFINALREIGHDEEDSAPTGVVRTTQTQAGYSSSRFPNVVLWDLPGLGITAQSMESYVKEMQFSQYDLFIIIASEQLSTNHRKLAQTLQDMGKKFYVVWTKLDRDLSTSVLSDAWLLQTIRENIQENLQKKGVHVPPIFLVSNFDPLLYDFPKLRDTLKTDLSNIRYDGPLEVCSQFCDKIISNKATILKERIIQKHPQDGADLKVLEDTQLSFGIDKQSLYRVAQDLKKPLIDYQSIMKYPDFESARRRDWKLRWLSCFYLRAFLSIVWYVPCFGVPIVNFFRHQKYKHIVELVARDNKIILRKMLRDAIFLLEELA
ncbi:immunity-related GTPase family M protein 1-like isoform 2-T2 [Thomomys bottae]